MPLRDGSLRQLVSAVNRPYELNDLANRVLQQMLSAIDYLDSNKLCHRDIKPENILYYDETNGAGIPTFQLADLGLANHSTAATSYCGSPLYMAPELHEQHKYKQSSKMDVWSLFATIADIHPRFAFPPHGCVQYSAVLEAIRIAATVIPKLAPMAEGNPAYRASAAQLLVDLYNGDGLTTPRANIPDILAEPTPSAIAAVTITTTPGPSRLVVAKSAPLIKYDRQPRRPRPAADSRPLPALRPQAAGISKSKPKPSAARRVNYGDAEE